MMRQKIIEIHSITAVQDWYFDMDTGNDPKDYEGIVCLALVTTMDLDDENHRVEKKIVPVESQDFYNFQVGEIYQVKYETLVRGNHIRMRNPK